MKTWWRCWEGYGGIPDWMEKSYSLFHAKFGRWKEIFSQFEGYDWEEIDCALEQCKAELMGWVDD